LSKIPPYVWRGGEREQFSKKGENHICSRDESGALKEEGIMHSKEELCEKIRSIYPDIGECAIDVNVEWDEEKKAWVVDLKKDKHHLKTHLEPEDADSCMKGKQCVSLGLQISQLRANIENIRD